MYLEYWGFREFPFENVPDQNFLYLSRSHEEALARMLYTVEMRKGGGLITGEIGCGKTMLTKALLNRLAGNRFNIGLVTNPSLTPEEFLKEISYQLNIQDTADTKTEVLRILKERTLSNMRENKETFLIIDEAQLLTYPTFEEVRLLLNFHLNNRFLLTIILVGQPELRIKVKGIEQLDQRLPVKYHLTPFNFKETALYIISRQKKAGRERNVFSRQAVERIYSHTRGVPRVINNVCDLALLMGFSKKKAIISSDTIEEIIRDGEIH